MFTKLLPAGDLFAYLVSERDGMGRPREFPAEALRGAAAAATRVLWALAPAGVAPAPRARFGVTMPERAAPRRAASDWVRHCEQHLVHFISCFHEGRLQVEADLPRIIRATENLVAAGLPRDALHFVWYRHSKALGTHAHGGMLRTVLFNGKPYAPQLDPALLLRFDRLVSCRLGYADPLSPAGFRVVYAAWGSAKEANAAEIKEICEAADAWWLSGRLLRHADFLKLLAERGYRCLASPDSEGTVRLRERPRFDGLRIPLRSHTVVVESRNHGRAICFKGPACRFDFRPEEFEAGLHERRMAVAALAANPRPVYDEFCALLTERIVAQHALWQDDGAHRVRLDDFRWLLPEGDLRLPVSEDQSREELDALDPLLRWSERAFPFASEAECAPGLAAPDARVGPPVDLADPNDGLLGEFVEEHLAQWTEDELATDVPDPAPLTPGAAPSGPPPRSARNLVETPVAAPRIPTPGVDLPKLPFPARHPRRPDKSDAAKRKRRKRRLRLAVQISLAVGHHFNPARDLSGPSRP